MSRQKRQRGADREERLHEAQAASAELDARGATVDRQLNLVGKLTDGWRKVHEVNHLAQLFSQEGRLG